MALPVSSQLILLATTALFAAFTQSASAADLKRAPAYIPASPPPPPVYFSWAGCYIGASSQILRTHRA